MAGDSKRIADLDAFWEEANQKDPTSSVYVHTFADGSMSMWAEGDRAVMLKAVVHVERVIVECESDGELH